MDLSGQYSTASPLDAKHCNEKATRSILILNNSHTHLYLHIYIIMIIIMSHNQRESPRPFPAILLYLPLLLVDLQATSCFGTELLYVSSSWSSCLYSSMCMSPQEYVTFEFVPTSPAVSRMFGSSNLDGFRDGVVSGRTAAVLCSTVSRHCSILLVVFLCSCLQTFCPYV